MDLTAERRNEHWRIEVTCLYCGGGVSFVNGTSNGHLAVTLVACVPCHRQFEVTTRISALAWTREEQDEHHRTVAA